MNNFLALGAHKEINKIKKELNLSNINLTVSEFSDIEMYISSEKIDIRVNDKSILDFDHIWLTSSWKNRSIAYAVSLFLAKSVVHYNKVEEEKSKLVDLILFAENGISIPNTYYTSTENLIDKFESIKKFCGLPFIIKSTRGSLGKNVHLIKSKKDLQAVLPTFSKNTYYICQQFIPNKFDYRVILDSGKIASICKRIRTSDSYRNNTYLGAKEVFINVKNIDKKILNMAKKSTDVLELDWSGVDIVTSSKTGENYILELNRRPGITKGSIELTAVYNYIVNLSK